mgnify:CR=1 FL=1
MSKRTLELEGGKARVETSNDVTANAGVGGAPSHGSDSTRPTRPAGPAALPHHPRGRVRTDRHKRRVTERQLPRVADEDVQALHGDHEDRDADDRADAFVGQGRVVGMAGRREERVERGNVEHLDPVS